MNIRTNRTNRISREEIYNIAKQFSADPYDLNSKCLLSVIPIYPVRYGLSIDYLNQARGSENTKSQVSAISQPSGMHPTEQHQLMQLRQGFVYIYADFHCGFSTDEAGKWLVFRHITHVNDINSGSQFDYPAGNLDRLCGKENCFYLYKWGKDGANGDWAPINLSEVYPCVNGCTFDTVFVHQNTQMVDIAYSEYAWTAEIFSALENNQELRSQIMTSINTAATSSAHTLPLNNLGGVVTEYSSKQDLAQISREWYTRIVNSPALPQVSFMPDYNEKGLIVALEDVVGEMHELQKIVQDLSLKNADYHKKYTYPITIGNIIDPKIAYDVRGKAYPFKPEERVIEQKGVKDALIKDFNEKYKKILKKAVDYYETPISELVKQIAKLASRTSFKSFFNLLDEMPENLVESLDKNVYIYNRLIVDCINAFECTEDGVKYLEEIFADKSPDDQSESIFHWLNEKVKTITDMVYHAAITIPIAQRKDMLKRYFLSMEALYLSTGRATAKIWAFKKSNIEKILAIYGLKKQTILEHPETVFNELADVLMKQHNSSAYDNRREYTGKQDIKRDNRKIRQALRTLNTTSAKEINEINKTLEFSERFYGFSGVLAIYTGILSLNNDLTINKKLARTALAKWSMDPIVARTTVILDISIGMIDVAYATKLINKPALSLAINSTKNILRGASPILVRGSLMSLFYYAGGIISGALSMVIAFGGLQEAIEKEDKVSMVANGAILSASAVQLIVSGMSLFTLSAEVLMVLSIASACVFVVILLAVGAIALWGDTPLDTWVKQGYWGKSVNYFYWNSPRSDYQAQTDQALLLANDKVRKQAEYIIQHTAFLEQQKVDGISGTDIKLTNGVTTEDIEKYLTVYYGLDHELYDYRILFGLRITQKSEHFLMIECEEFRKTLPTENNLTVKSTLLDSGKWQRVPFEIINKETLFTPYVLINLEESQLINKAFCIEAEFIDKEGNSFSDRYESPEFKSEQQKMIINHALQHIH